MGLAEKFDAYARQLSGGQQQRVAIARALAMEPAVLLCDEITRALDPELVGEVLRVVESLADEGMTLLMVTHEMSFARKVSDRVIFMHQGRVHEMGPPDQLFGNPQTPELQAVHLVAERLTRFSSTGPGRGDGQFARQSAACNPISYTFNSKLSSIDVDLKAIFLAFLLAMPLGPATAFDLQGHRGARGLAPENTLAAFERALEIGVTTLELDVGITADGVAVVAHDPALNPALARDGSGRWIAGPGPALRSLTVDQLQRYDVGRIDPASPYAGTFATQAPRDGQRIPRLAQVFERVKQLGADGVRFNIETKINPTRPDETANPEDVRQRHRARGPRRGPDRACHPAKLRLAHAADCAGHRASPADGVPEHPDGQQRQHPRRHVDRRLQAGRPRQRAPDGQGGGRRRLVAQRRRPHRGAAQGAPRRSA